MTKIKMRTIIYKNQVYLLQSDVALLLREFGGVEEPDVRNRIEALIPGIYEAEPLD